VALPPPTGRLVGLAVFATRIWGAAAGPEVTLTESVAAAVWPLSAVAALMSSLTPTFVALVPPVF
jgi:hypothetical protein